MMADSRMLFLAPFFLSFCVSASAAKRVVIDNPYQDVVWSKTADAEAWQRHKANLHTHTSESGSDAHYSPAQVVDNYRAKGYTVLAITDHNKLTWPWTNYDRNPDSLDMVAIPGNEFSNGHHRNAFFCNIDGNPGKDVKKTLNRIASKGGLSVLNHPGRYSNTIAWYLDIYRKIPSCIGLEVFNQGDRYPEDRKKWDKILIKLMPDRPVWGYSNDDMHREGQYFSNYSVLFVPALTDKEVRLALEHGHSYFCYEPGRSGEAKAPAIDSVSVDTITARISISAVNDTLIEWISGGKIITTGNAITCPDHFTEKSEARYVRARILGTDGETNTQPFGIRFTDAPLTPVVASHRRPPIAVRYTIEADRITFQPAEGGPFALILCDLSGRTIASVSGSGTVFHHLRTGRLAEGSYILSGHINGRKFSDRILRSSVSTKRVRKEIPAVR